MPATVTEELAATTGASTAVTFDLGVGERATFISTGMIRDDSVTVEVVFSDGVHRPYTFINAQGQRVSAVMDKSAMSVSLDGPLKGRLNKPLTMGSVKIDSHT